MIFFWGRLSADVHVGRMTTKLVLKSGDVSITLDSLDITFVTKPGFSKKRPKCSYRSWPEVMKYLVTCFWRVYMDLHWLCLIQCTIYAHTFSPQPMSPSLLWFVHHLYFCFSVPEVVSLPYPFLHLNSLDMTQFPLTRVRLGPRLLLSPLFTVYSYFPVIPDRGPGFTVY